jgi:ribosomal protein S18 acetylase RimI-like enzyme
VKQGMVELRSADLSDGHAIARVLAESFAEMRAQYTPAAFAATVPGPEQIDRRLSEGPVWVGLLDGRIVATGSAVVRADGLYVRGMGVVPEARGQAFGWRLLEVMEEFARRRGLERMYLSTTPFLRRAIRLYERYGFERTGEPPHEMYGTRLFTMSKPVVRSIAEGERLPPR